MSTLPSKPPEPAFGRTGKDCAVAGRPVSSQQTFQPVTACDKSAPALFCSAPALLKSTGRDGALLCRGVGDDRPRSGSRQGCRLLFASTRMCCRKARPRLTDLPGMASAWMHELRQRRSGCPMPGNRQAGWPSLLVTFLLATQRKSDSVAAGDRPLLIFRLPIRHRANAVQEAQQTTTIPPAGLHNSTPHPQYAPARYTDAPSCAWRR